MGGKKKLNIRRTVKNIAYFARLIRRGAPGMLVFAAAYGAFSAFSAFLGYTYVLMYVLNAIQAGVNVREILITVAVILGVLVLSGFVNLFWEMYFESAIIKVEKYINGLVYKKAAEIDLACYESPEFLDTYLKASSEGISRARSLIMSVQYSVYDIVNGVSNIALIAAIAPVFLLLAGVPFLCTVLVGRKRNRFRHDYQMRTREVERRRDYVRRTFYLGDFAKEMRLTSMWKVMFRRMSTAVDELFAIQKKYGVGLMFFAYLYDQLFDVIVSTGSKLLALYKTLVVKDMPVGDCFVAVNSAENIAYGLNGIGESLLEFDEHSIYIEDFRRFIETEVKIAENGEAPDPGPFESLTLRNVGYTYPSSDKSALSDVSFTVKKGERIAIVGHNGAGKSTLVKLLLRLYDPGEGEILWNGKDIKELRLSSYRAGFATVFQDPKLFSVSVAENVMQKGDLTAEEKVTAQKALENAGIAGKINELSKGADTTVTREFDSDGAVFSGGEAQKVAVARVFASPADVVIMDEPTSALDPIAEQEMYSNMFRACEGKTVIYISHRLSSAVFADRVYMFEHGKIVEQGSHARLLELNGKYADMWHKQADAYAPAAEGGAER